jgi:hypothetical protein
VTQTGAWPAAHGGTRGTPPPRNPMHCTSIDAFDRARTFGTVRNTAGVAQYSDQATGDDTAFRPCLGPTQPPPRYSGYRRLPSAGINFTAALLVSGPVVFNLRKTMKVSLGIHGIPVKIRTEHLPSASLGISATAAYVELFLHATCALMV